MLPLAHTVLVVVLFVIFSGVRTQAQAPQFSQFYASPLYLAPSFAGATDGSRLVLNYRNQWPEIPGGFITYAFSLDHYFHNYNSGVGIVLFRDQAGSGRLASTKGAMAYSYHFSLDHNWTVRPGVQFSFEERTLDFSRLIFSDQLSLVNGINPGSYTSQSFERIGYFDAASSVLVYSSNIWAGLAVDHLMSPNQSMTSHEISRVPPKFSVFGGYRFTYGGRFAEQLQESISLAVVYKNQGMFNQLDLGAYWSKNPISLGLLYRGIPVFNNHVHGFANNDALVFIGGLRTKNMRIGYSYDFTISRLINNTGGAHEVSLIYQFNQGPPGKRQGKIPCPEGQL